jgi:TonB family protein
MTASRSSAWSAVVLFAALASGCGEGSSASKLRLGNAPDELPRVRNEQLPFRYPADQYSRRVQGNVTLRLYVDSGGRVLTDSTRVEESSGYTALDSAAVKGSQELAFEPARRKGKAVPVTVLFPVYFRHPEAAPLTDDTILQNARPR